MEVITLKFNKTYISRFVQSTKADVVLRVELRIYKWLDLTVFSPLLEPSSLFRNDNRILAEFDEHGLVDLREVLLAQGFNR